METIEQYFKHSDTPASKSPTALAMLELLAIRKELSFDDARRLVNDIGPSLYSPKKCAKKAIEKMAGTSQRAA